DVLTAKRDATQRVHVQTLERPDAWLLLLCRQIGVEMLIQSFIGRDGRVVVPGQKLSRNNFVNTNFVQPEINSLLQFALNLILPNNRDDDAGRSNKSLAHLERSPHIADLSIPPFLRGLGHPAARRTQLRVRLCIACIHRELYQVNTGDAETYAK